MAAPLCHIRRLLVRLHNSHSTRQFLTCRQTFSSTTSDKNGADQKTTHFGFETVLENEKEEKVYEVFKNVADTYDLMNDAMSGGIHRLWKDHFISRLAPPSGTKLIDVAGGTGDIAFRFIRYMESQRKSKEGSSFEFSEEGRGSLYSDPVDSTLSSSESSSTSDSSEDEQTAGTKSSYHVTVCDINQSMLDVGKGRAAEAGIIQGISWLKGNAESLPLTDNTFDAYTIAYGIRNCTHVDKVVEEAYRVLKPGGRFMCLEFSEVPNPLIKKVYDEYSFQVIPVLGQVLARDWHSYQYLVESIRNFPDQEAFKKIIETAGFRAVTYENLTFGVTAIHSGFKL